MLFDLTIIGFGVIGVETLHGIKKSLLQNKNKNKNQIKIKIAIIEKNLENVPGGIAYSLKNSRFGFFNNPLRLSHPEFIKWFKLNDNKKRLIDFSKNNPNYNLSHWLKDNESILYKKFKDYKEIYLPRLVYSFFLKDKIIDFLNFKKKLDISLRIYQGEVNHLINETDYSIFPKKFFKESFINYDKKKTDT